MTDEIEMGEPVYGAANRARAILLRIGQMQAFYARPDTPTDSRAEMARRISVDWGRLADLHDKEEPA